MKKDNNEDNKKQIIIMIINNPEVIVRIATNLLCSCLLPSCRSLSDLKKLGLGIV